MSKSGEFHTLFVTRLDQIRLSLKVLEQTCLGLATEDASLEPNRAKAPRISISFHYA